MMMMWNRRSCWWRFRKSSDVFLMFLCFLIGAERCGRTQSIFTVTIIIVVLIAVTFSLFSFLMNMMKMMMIGILCSTDDRIITIVRVKRQRKDVDIFLVLDESQGNRSSSLHSIVSARTGQRGATDAERRGDARRGQQRRSGGCNDRRSAGDGGDGCSADAEDRGSRADRSRDGSRDGPKRAGEGRGGEASGHEHQAAADDNKAADFRESDQAFLDPALGGGEGSLTASDFFARCNGSLLLEVLDWKERNAEDLREAANVGAAACRVAALPKAGLYEQNDESDAFTQCRAETKNVRGSICLLIADELQDHFIGHGIFFSGRVICLTRNGRR